MFFRGARREGTRRFKTTYEVALACQVDVKSEIAKCEELERRELGRRDRRTCDDLKRSVG